jgi:hypothetical protein
VRNPPRVPLFEDVLCTFGGRVILAVEAKHNAAYQPMMAMVERYGLRDSVIVKAHFASSNWMAAQRAGYPVFCYFGSVGEATAEAVRQTAARLRPGRDYLVVPAYAGPNTCVDDSLITTAVATGIPTWVFPLHRRSDATHFFHLGAQGAMCASYGYISGAVEPVSVDSWATQAIASGEMSLDPSNLTVAFGRADDSYFENRQGRGSGYHVILRANGSLALYRHRDCQVKGELLAPAISTPRLRAGQWATLKIEISGNEIAVTRTDSGSRLTAIAEDGVSGFVHLGRDSPDGVAEFRSLTIS